MESTQTDSSRTKARERIRSSVLGRRLWKGLTVGVVTGLLGTILALTPLGNDFEKNVGLAWLFKIRGATVPPPEVAVVAINERASIKLGLPPLPRDWPRSIHGTLIDNLVQRGASVIVFDVDFRRPKSAEHDLAFAKAVARSGRTVLVETLNGKRAPILDARGRQSGTIWIEELLSPIGPLTEAAKGLGPFPVPKVQVNVFQFWAFKPSVGDAPTLPVVALQLYLLNTYERWLDVLAKARANGLEKLPRQRDALVSAADLRKMMRAQQRIFRDDPSLFDRIDGVLAMEREHGLSDTDYRAFRALSRLYAGTDSRFLSFYGPPGSIATIPYNAVITGNDPSVDAAMLDFTNKVVFVGFSDLFDPGQPDRFYTVFTRDDGVDLSGVEIAATAFANLLTDRTLRPSGALTTATILFLFGVILGSGVYLLTAWIAVPLALLLTGVYIGGVQFVFNTADVWLPLATPVLVQLPLAVFVGLLTQYLLERRRQKRFSKAVSYYLPDHVARELTEKELDPDSLNKIVYGICLATDMSGFTTISQSMEPSKLAALMNSYFDALAQALKRHHVDVTEFHADTIMCAWTATDSSTLDRQNALFAALDVRDAIDQFNTVVEGVNLYARIGMEEGEFYLGHTGGGGRLGYTILGDCANTSARLESLNQHLGTHILTSQNVVERASDLLLRPLGKFQLVGRSDPIPVVEIVAKKIKANEPQNRLCQRFAEALELFQKEEWSRATEHFRAILKEYPDDGPSRFYFKLCQDYQKNAPQIDDPSVIYMKAK